ncbi:MAG: prolyl oligopeptidase family serine peptidase [Lachnospiraceae bacterium]|nr:prolyl oligopeptidase family serine peptidase [Lachnospiraceae bacterium]
MKRNRLFRMLVLAAASVLALSAAGCGSGSNGGSASGSSSAESGADASSAEESAAESLQEESVSAGSTAESAAESLPEELDRAAEIAALAAGADQQPAAAKILVRGYEWGPGVPKLIVELPAEAEEVTWDSPVVAMAGTERVVSGFYLADENGEPLEEEGPSKYAAIDFETNYANSGSPFTYDFMVTFMNNWSENYPVQAYFEATVDGAATTFGLDADLIGSRICPDTDVFNERGEFTGDYTNPMTEETESITLQYAAYMPETLAGDGVKNPLIIWLHGQGEGGTDPDIALLGNEVVALAKENIQSRFGSEGGENGIYVLACQTRTYWMDGGDGTNSNGDLVSRYTEALMDMIEKFVNEHEDIDANRIYLGGCSNGGYMTMNMLVQYPDYWAAAYPCCEAYSYYMYERNEDGSYKTEVIPTDSWPITQYFPLEERWMSEEKVEAIKDIPIWFLQSADDTTVAPASFGMPTYRALLKAGADNCWFSMFETVNGTDDNEGAQYMGHWSWVYLFNDQVTAVQDPEAVKASADDDESFGFAPSNEGGGSLEANGFRNIFDWLNEQSR